jgi:hypothetical protein
VERENLVLYSVAKPSRRGETGSDISKYTEMPSKVEFRNTRDGVRANTVSDAIAGVMNIISKDRRRIVIIIGGNSTSKAMGNDHVNGSGKLMLICKPY